MKTLVLIFSLLLVNNADAENGRFDIFSIEKQPIELKTSKWLIEYEFYGKSKEEEKWVLGMKDTLCFGIKVEGCYHWVGGNQSTALLPSDPNDPITYENFNYGIGFTQPDAKKMMTSYSSQDHQRKYGGDGEWNPILPMNLKSSHKSKLNKWNELETRVSEDRYVKIRARLIEAK